MATSEALKILLVDDEPLARDRLRTLLGDMVHQQPTEVLGEAGNGLEALAFLREQSVDVILADIRMPGISGLDVARQVVAQGGLVVFTTAYEDYAIRAFEAGAADYLLKPVQDARLAQAVERMRARLAEARAPDMRSLIDDLEARLRPQAKGG